MGCNGSKSATEKYFSFDESKFKSEYNNDDSLSLRLLNGENKKIECIPCNYTASSHWNLKIHNLSYHSKKEDKLLMVASFGVKPEDFNIKIPKIVSSKIAGIINISLAYEFIEKK